MILLRSRDVVEKDLLGGWLEVDAEGFTSSLREIPGDKCNARERFVFMAPLLNSSKYSNERRFDVRRKEEEGKKKKAMQNYVLGLSIILYIEHRVHISRAEGATDSENRNPHITGRNTRVQPLGDVEGFFFFAKKKHTKTTGICARSNWTKGNDGGVLCLCRVA